MDLRELLLSFRYSFQPKLPHSGYSSSTELSGITRAPEDNKLHDMGTRVTLAMDDARIPDLRPCSPSSAFSAKFPQWNYEKELLYELYALRSAPERTSTLLIQSLCLGENQSSRWSENAFKELILFFPCILYALLNPRAHKSLGISEKLSSGVPASTPVILESLILYNCDEFIQKVYPDRGELYSIIEEQTLPKQLSLLKRIESPEVFRIFFPQIALKIYEKKNEKEGAELRYKFRTETAGNYLWKNNKELVLSLPMNILYLLRYYVSHSRTRLVELITSDVELTGVDIWKEILGESARTGNTKLIALALAHGAPLTNSSSSRMYFHARLGSRANRHPLEIAMKNNEIEAVKLLCSSKEVYNDSGFQEEYFSPIQLAVELGSLSLTLILLENGHDPNILNENTTALKNAVSRNSFAIAKALLDGGADPNLCSGELLSPPLRAAVLRRRYAISILLLERGARVDLQDSLGYTPLLHALQHNDMKSCQLLLENSADPSIRARNGVSPIFMASKGPSSVTRAFKALVDRFFTPLEAQ